MKEPTDPKTTAPMVKININQTTTIVIFWNVDFFSFFFAKMNHPLILITKILYI